MKMKLGLDDGELAELLKALDMLSVKHKKKVTLNGLLTNWAYLVTTVERGYDDCIYEYTNDLSVRDMIETVLTSVSASAGAKIRKAVAPWDERFERATGRSNVSLNKGDLRHAWWNRIPHKLSNELGEDLRDRGIYELNA